ncbi:helix-turn-helix domain-containing protein [Streptomyces sp. NPDC059835]|uniref:helix-turn-helix domain-containing protein n=2 Tax=Streptomyces TaxID=1883 RepID=UPI00364EF8DA
MFLRTDADQLLTFLTHRQVDSEGLARSLGPPPRRRRQPTQRPSTVVQDRPRCEQIHGGGVGSRHTPAPAHGIDPPGLRRPLRPLWRHRSPLVTGNERSRRRGNIAANSRLAKPGILVTIGVVRTTAPDDATRRALTHASDFCQTARRPAFRIGAASLKGAPLPADPQTPLERTSSGTSSPHGRRPVEPVLMDSTEVATMLNMSRSWVYKEASKLGLKGYKLGRGRNAKVLYKKTEVFKWLEQQKIH